MTIYLNLILTLTLPVWLQSTGVSEDTPPPLLLPGAISIGVYPWCSLSTVPCTHGTQRNNARLGVCATHHSFAEMAGTSRPSCERRCHATMPTEATKGISPGQDDPHGWLLMPPYRSRTGKRACEGVTCALILFYMGQWPPLLSLSRPPHHRSREPCLCYPVCAVCAIKRSLQAE